MEICATPADDGFLDDVRERVKRDPNATLDRWEAIRLLLHIEHQAELIEDRGIDRDMLRDELDQIRNTHAS